ncbi:hypothetical protein H1R20_g5550, partial [Candolleomyces eurysporus]
MSTGLKDDSVESQKACPGPTGKEELYYWDTVCFSVEGRIFKVPRQHFIVGSEYFANKYLRPQAYQEGDPRGSEIATFDPDALVTLKGISATAFRTFLKLLFPSLTSTLTLTLTKSEWLTTLSLSTTWHFLQFRELAIQQLGPHLTDPIELVKSGRENFVCAWVMDGYDALVRRNGTISERESEEIGHLTTVRIYLVRGALGKGDGPRYSSELSVFNEIHLKFGEELRILGAAEKKFKIKTCPKSRKRIRI